MLVSAKNARVSAVFFVFQRRDPQPKNQPKAFHAG